MIRLIFAAALISFSFTLHAGGPAPRILLLDGAQSGSDIIVVGERGVILRSTDHGGSWDRVSGTSQATLTGISFAPAPAAQIGWAVGHDALILGTTDGGKTWTKAFQGENLQDSFLDVIALDAQRAIAVGAYGLYVTTIDGGKTWARRKLNKDDYHFNRITAGEGSTLYLAGEHGTLLRSTDLGAKWSALKTPYDGSFYGLIALERRVLLAYGLRGRIFRSEDDGKSWQSVETPEPVLLASAVKLKSGELLLGGQSRSLLRSDDNGATFSAVTDCLPGGIARLLALMNGSVLAIGETGVTVLDPSRLPVRAISTAGRVP